MAFRQFIVERPGEAGPEPIDDVVRVLMRRHIAQIKALKRFEIVAQSPSILGSGDGEKIRVIIEFDDDELDGAQSAEMLLDMLKDDSLFPRLRLVEVQQVNVQNEEI